VWNEFWSADGFIVGIVQGKPKGVKMIGISFMFALFWNIVRLVIAVLAEQPR